jgi:hypothetical protein
MPAEAPKPIPFTQFGGLVLNRPLDEVGADNAIDLLDTDWNAAGDPCSRPGADEFTNAAGAANYESLFAHSDTRLLARRGTTLVAFDIATGEEVAGKSAVVKQLHMSFARLGTPSASYSYIADRENTLKRYDGTDFTSPNATVDGEAAKAMPKGRHLATWADEGNRLVIAGTDVNGGPAGAISSGSHVWFANPGDAEGYESRNFVQVRPGDGESIVACCAWGGQVFVFKETRLFVFYGVSLDNEGKPIFNFRTVELGTRILPPSSKCGPQVAAGAEGVYFVANDGLYMTTGSEPSLLSSELDPLADSQPLIGPAAATFGERRWTQARGITYVGEAVYVGLGSAEGVVDRLLKFDLRGLRWTVWSAELHSMVPWNAETATHRERLFFSAADAEHKGVFFYTPEKDADPTTEMEPRWQSGFYDLDGADEKTLVNAKMWGTGNVDLKVAEDYGALGKATEFKLGAAPAVGQRQHQKGQSATVFSHQLSGDAPWSVQRLDRYLRETRVAETQKKS